MTIRLFKFFTSPTTSIKLGFSQFRSIFKTFKTNDSTQALRLNHRIEPRSFKQNAQFHTETMLSYSKTIQDNITALQMKKRPIRKKRTIIKPDDSHNSGTWNVKALATADDYDLESLVDGILQQNLYTPIDIQSSDKSIADAIQVIAKYEVASEPREIFFFRQGTIVMWNISDLECNNILEFLKQFEENSYSDDLIKAEQEIMHYTYTEEGKRSHLKKGDIHLCPNKNLDRYTFSNALSQTVKLGIWEASLDRYIESIEFITEDLKQGNKILMTRPSVLRKQGELFALRHFINLSSDLLDTPDFYWELDDLEILYHKTCGYFNITKRTRVMNEKINHCVELVELLSSHLSDRHHVRLEWMIIVLIMVEVGFETLHYLDRYLAKYEEASILLK